MSSILRIKNAAHFEFFTQTDFSITAYTKERLKSSAFPDMRIKHRLMWNKLPSGRAYSMITKVGKLFLINYFFHNKIFINFVLKKS